MANDNQIAFLCSRLKELREKNGCTMDDMAKKIDVLEGLKPGTGMNKSSISRVEGGKTAEKTLLEMARKYCKVFGMSESQTEQFLRGEKVAVPDTSALLKNSQLIDELNKEYSKVVIPKVVVDELDNIKNKNSGSLGRKAWEVIRGISYGSRTILMEYNGDESLSGLVPIYDHSLVILADEDEEVKADIVICKSNSGISGSRLAAAHVRLGEKIGRHIAVFPEKNTSILVLERGGRFFGDGVYMGAGGIFYSMNPKQDDTPVINTERVVIVDSVINTGKSIMRIIDELKNHNPGIDVIIAANVIQNEAAELFKDYLVFATRLSKNSFVGVNQSKQTGKTGPDTADRLFNLIKKRY